MATATEEHKTEEAPTPEQAAQFKSLLQDLLSYTQDGTWTQPDQRLRDLVDRVRAALAAKAKTAK